MIDASSLSFEENVEEVIRAVRYCHFYGIPVEAELGALQGKEEDIVNEADAKTDPAMVKDFVTSTGCDLLAVSVGNVHGLDLEPHVDLELLRTIADISPVPDLRPPVLSVCCTTASLVGLLLQNARWQTSRCCFPNRTPARAHEASQRYACTVPA